MRGGRAPARRVFALLVGDSTALVVALSFLSALVVGALIIVVATPPALAAWGNFFADPLDALYESVVAIGTAYGALLSGALGSPAGISETLVSSTPYLVAGLGVALAFRAGLFNIGGQGQLIVGGISATWAGFAFPGLPIFLHLPLAILAGAAGGAIWGFVPGLLKAWTGAHEVITSMMLNYVGLNLLTWFLSVHAFQAPPFNQAISRSVAATSRLPHIAGPSLRVNLGIVLGVLLAVGAAWLLRQSTLGFQFRMIGLNLRAARVAGAGVRRLTMAAMALSGMLVGLAGTFMVLGVDYQMSPNYGGTFGFDAITVAILGRGSPLGVVLSALLFGAFQAGGRAMQVSTGIPLQLVEVLQAVIVLFVAAPGVIRTIYRIRVRGRGERVFGGWAA